MAIVKRLVKGSALTQAELDGNFDTLVAADTTEASARSTADAVIASAITDEQTARIAGDSAAVTAAVASANGYTDAKVEGLQYKNPVLVATTENITLSGNQTIDGVSVPNQARVLVKDQTNATENGIYIKVTMGWTRSADFNLDAEIPLARVEVASGTVNAGKAFKVTNTSVVLGTDNINIVEVAVSGLIPSSEKGAANGVASLDSGGKVPLTQLPIAIPQTTGVALNFLNDRVYGSKVAPETGNITVDVTGALLGVTNLIIHNHSSAPTFDSKFKKLTGSGSYVTGVNNYIYCTYIASDEIIYAINQIL